MRVAVYSTKPYDEEYLDGPLRAAGAEPSWFEARLTPATAALAADHEAVCCFVNDDLGRATIEVLAKHGVRFVALRSAGFNHVDLDAAAEHGLAVGRVPAYSPYAVAEHTLALILALNRRIHRAYNRVRDGNFSLNGLLGFDVHGKTIGIIGTGKIGTVFSRMMRGFHCTRLAYDPFPSEEARQTGLEYTTLDEVVRRADILTLFAPLTPDTHHLVNAERIAAMRDRVMIVNCSRGALIDTRAVIEALKDGKIGALGLDVYEEEEGLFFEDLSNQVITDDVFSRLLTFPNVLITGHQAFFTSEALAHIARITAGNLRAFAEGGDFNEVRAT
jgi:D-lactate dehydrogenase